MLIKKISKAGKSLMAGFLAAGLISAAAWLVAPAVLPNQQMIVYAAEVQTASQSILANTENGQVRGFAKGGVRY